MDGSLDLDESSDVDETTSSESSFYGDELEKSIWEKEAVKFDPATWSSRHLDSLTTIANSNAKVVAAARPKVEPEVARLFNLLEGNMAAKQLGESVDEFLDRLPPLTSQEATVGPWIWVANPHTSERLLDHDYTGLKEEGGLLLSELKEEKSKLEAMMKGKTKGTITKAYNPIKKQYEERILQLAQDKNITSGKWMLFPPEDAVTRVWATVAKAVVDNELGVQAKVATWRSRDSPIRLVCIYTKDFSNVADVKRVLRKLSQLGLVAREKQAIYYKCDAYTYLDLSSGNEWSIKASMYASSELLAR
ncbi:MAG: hypothetical protein M1814_002574 [Vezdaea aestivalis]|nr:MAG: hypothetical protein M1814_002574 [Vezdaea aestivalis]